MINVIYKIINNKFSRIFKFVFFLRYLLALFLISSASFLIIPKFFDYKKREELIKSSLLSTYGLEVESLGKIEFKSLPLPYLEVKDLEGKLILKNIEFKSEKLNIFPKLSSIYDFNDFKIKKIKLENNKIVADVNDIIYFFRNIFEFKAKIDLKNSNLSINETSNYLLKLENINLKNYGFKRNEITGLVFNRIFKIKILNDFKKINFDLLNTGISLTLNIFESEKKLKYKGDFIGKILKSNFKSNFLFSEGVLNIEDFIFRDKNFSFNSKGQIALKPYLVIDLKTKFKDINISIIKNLDINKLLEFREIIKLISIQNNIIFESKKFSSNLIDDLKIKINMGYGRLAILKSFSISESKFDCSGNINLTDDFPILFFSCSAENLNKDEFFKKFNIKNKLRDKILDVKVNGNINILNNKINFSSITSSNNFKATNEDFKFFKKAFEEYLFDENFLAIFNLEKLEKFFRKII